jgi:hypothetical protein
MTRHESACIIVRVFVSSETLRRGCRCVGGMTDDVRQPLRWTNGQSRGSTLWLLATGRFSGRRSAVSRDCADATSCSSVHSSARAIPSTMLYAGFECPFSTCEIHDWSSPVRLASSSCVRPSSSRRRQIARPSAT